MTRNETPLDWNAEERTGATGPTGSRSTWPREVPR
jgi:hypothetical protein